jgi:hypothetical protein
MSQVSSILGTSRLPLCLNDILPECIDDFRVHNVSADGNCFFHSVSVILNDLNLCVDVPKLRQIVAKSVLNPEDESTNDTIRNWLIIYQGAIKEQPPDLGLLEEYKHMRNLDQAVYPISSNERQILYNNMQTTLFWGEEFAMRTMEQKTRIRFLIINRVLGRTDVYPSLCWYHDESYVPKYYAILFLDIGRCNHYRPVSYRGKFIWSWLNLPEQFRIFMQRAYVQQAPPVTVKAK